MYATNKGTTAYAVAIGSIAAIWNWYGQRERQDLMLKFLAELAESIRDYPWPVLQATM